MTDKLPPNLLALFAPRPALRYLPPSDHAPEERVTSHIGGVAAYLSALKSYGEEVPYTPTESWLQRRDRKKMERKEELEHRMTVGVKSYDPSTDSQIRGDAFKTLFVGRLGYGVREEDLEREFARFGPIERIRIVNDTQEASSGKKSKKAHRGYAFIVYEREKDMKAAYKETDGIRIKDRRVLVDVERGRTVKGWRPRRFGGGLGGRGYMKAAPARPAGPGGFAAPAGPGGFQGGGGFRGGFGRGGGFRGGRGDFGDRGGFGGRGDRGGFGGRGGIGYRGDFGGGSGRGGYQNGFGSGQPPPNAPSGPGGRGGGFGGYGGGATNGSARDDGPGPGGYGSGGPRGDFGDRGGYRGGGGRYNDRGDSRGGTGSNREPVRMRDGFERDGGSAREGGSMRDSGGARDGGSTRDGGRDGHREPRDRDRGDRDRDRYGGGRRDDDHSRKRYHDGDGYDDPRSKRRY